MFQDQKTNKKQDSITKEAPDTLKENNLFCHHYFFNMYFFMIKGRISLKYMYMFHFLVSF